MKTPNEEAAERIEAVLKEKNLLKESALKHLSTKLSTGAMSDSEWVELVKNDLQKEVINEQIQSTKNGVEVD